MGCEVHVSHDVSCLCGRSLGALLPVDAYEVRQGGGAGEQRGRLAAEQGQEHLFKQQRAGDALHTADGGVRQLQRGGGEDNQFDICGECEASVRIFVFNSHKEKEDVIDMT